MMHRNPSVNVHKFAMVPRADIPRSKFIREFTHKTTFNAGGLIPIYVDEVLPGDSFNLTMVGFTRMSTPIFPIMDNLHLDTFFFFVPNRLVWSNWQKFMGQQDSPGDSISYSIPQIVSKVGGYDPCSVFDYFGLPTAGQVGAGNTVSHSALPLRAYSLIFNEWFRDENLVLPFARNMGDGPDLYTDYSIATRNKRHDYFTSALPWTQKGTAVSLPLGTTAPVKGYFAYSESLTSSVNGGFMQRSTTAVNAPLQTSAIGTANTTLAANPLLANSLYADLSAATAATINQLRQSFQIQKLLERDARGGTRYTEIIRAHFGVISPDARLQRPEYLGGGSSPITINPVAQTSGTGVTGGTTPLANLAAIGTGLAPRHGFSRSFTEHGYIIGLVNVRADLTYQQGMRKMWSRLTRYDFYFPAFANLGEQSIFNREIFCDGSANDALTFGYQERWAEMRYLPSMITGMFRSTTTGTLDAWHLAQKFATLPLLNSSFIYENIPMSRVLAAGALADKQQFIFDSFFRVVSARPMPLYSVPGLIDHF